MFPFSGLNMSHQVLIYSRFPKAQMVRIGERYDLLDGVGNPPIETFSAEQLKPIRAIITAGGQVIPPAVLDTLPSLGAIICYGTGYDGVDFAETAKRRIVVGNSPAANAAAVADLAMTLKAELRKASDAIRAARLACRVHEALPREGCRPVLRT